MTIKHVTGLQVIHSPTLAGRPSAVISTDRVDSERDIIQQAGLRFRERLRVMVSHDYKELPVGQVTSITRAPGRTIAEWRWLEGDARADRVRNAFGQGMLDASVGMRVDDAKPNVGGGFTITSAEVIEFSLTAVPVNVDCAPFLRSLFAGAGRAAPGGDDVVLELVETGAGRFSYADRGRAEGAYLDLVDRPIVARGVETTFDVDVTALRGAVLEVMRESLQEVAKATAAREIRLAMTALTGRLD